MAPRRKRVISIEEAPRFRTKRNLTHLTWYVLSHSAMLFWAEMMLVLIGFATTPADKEFPFKGALVSLALFNAIVSMALTFKAMERDTTERYRNARRFAIRYFPVLMVVSLPVRIVRHYVWRRKRVRPRGIIVMSSYRIPDGGDDAA